MVTEGIDLFKLLDAREAVIRAYENATSGDDARDLEIARNMLDRVVGRDRSHHKCNRECGCVPKTRS